MPRLGRSYPNNQNIVLSAPLVSAVDTDISLAGVLGVGKVGTVVLVGDTSPTLTGVSGIGKVGAVALDISLALAVANARSVGQVGTTTVSTEVDITLSLVGVDSIGAAGIVIIDPEGLTFWICANAEDQDWTCVLVPDMHGQKD